MHYSAALRPLPVHRKMKKGFFAWLLAGKQISVPVQLGKNAGIEISERRIGWCDQPAIRQAYTDITAAPRAQPAAIQVQSDFDNLFSTFRVAFHIPASRSCHASIKNCSDPKFPDLSARAILRFAPSATVQGTPGAISGPICRKSTASCFTTAPDVSPPATMNCE